MSSEIVFDVRLRVMQGNGVLLEQGMDLESRFESEQATYLILGQRAGAIALDGKRFQSVSRKIRPSAFKSSGDVIRQIECDLHRQVF